MRIINLLIIASLLVCASGCSTMRNIFKPVPFKMGKAPPGSPEFQFGWNQGCETGLSTMNYDYYKTFYKFRQDPTMAQHEEYYRAWKDAYTYCRQYAFKWADWSWEVPENTDANRDAVGTTDNMFIEP